MMVYRVVATYEDSEIGEGIGESLDYAIGECVDGIPSIYFDDSNNIKYQTYYEQI